MKSMENDLDLFIKAMDDVRRKTEAESDKNVWAELRQKWESHYIDKIPDDLKKKRADLLIAVRFTESYQAICWIEWLSTHGGYLLAMRELRYHLEAVVQAHYIDSKYPDIDIDGKLAVLREIMDIGKSKSHGSQLIEISNLPRKEELKGLYKELCQFVHPTHEQISRIFERRDPDKKIVELMSPTYDDEMFKECCELGRRVFEEIIRINLDFVRSQVRS